MKQPSILTHIMKKKSKFYVFNNKVYFNLIMQTNYDKVVDLEEKIVSFSPLPPFWGKTFS